MSTNLSLQERHERCLYPCVRIRTPKALGSGTILYYENAPDAPGQVDRYVLTNEHVIDNLVAVEKRWNSMLRREVKVDILGLPTVEVFTFAYTSRTIGFTGYQAEIVAYDKEEDLALLRVRAPAVGPIYAATLVPREQVNDLQSFMGCWNIGCGLGAKPVLTFGYLSAFGYDIENKDYMQVSAPSIFGNSGGATFLEETGEMIGVPARISVSGFGDAITHIGFSITAERIYKFLDEHVFDFVYGSGRTSEECAQERKKRREMDVDKRSQREEDEED